MFAAKRMSSVQNGSITRATTEIAIEGFLDVDFGRRRVVSHEGIETHDEAWCTESALAAITHGQPFLDSMRPLDMADALDADDMLAIYANQRGETGIDGGVVELLGGWVVLGYHNGTGATSTLGTSELRPRQTDTSDVLEQGDVRVEGVEDHFLAVQIEGQDIIVVLGDE